VKHLTRIALGLVVIAAFVYGFHWAGERFHDQLGVPVSVTGLQRYILLTIWGGLTTFIGAAGVAIGIGIAHGIGGQFLRDKPVSRDHTEWGGEWKDNPNNGISPYDLPK